MWKAVFYFLHGLTMLTLPTLAQAQQPPAAGRVVLAVGAVQIQRGREVLQARTGVPVRSGDTIVTAPASSAQVWLTDGSMVAVRERSQFRLDSYRYDPKGNGSNQVTSIVKGGARMVQVPSGRPIPLQSRSIPAWR